MIDKLPFYEWLKGHDVFSWLEPLWNSGNWFINWNGKLEPIRTQVAPDTPWVHHGHQERADCFLGQLVFSVVAQRMKEFFADGESFVPSACQDCYKVVVRPKTLIQLFALDDLQANLGLPCKCGIEPRGSVHGLYGGYFYNRSLVAGQECYRKVRMAIDEDSYLGPKIPIILKRACTEMEHGVGPSDKWIISEEQQVVEELIREWLVIPDDFQDQPTPVIWRTKRKWIEFAYAYGDETYKKFTGGKPITPGYVTYHKEGSNLWTVDMNTSTNLATSKSAA